MIVWDLRVDYHVAFFALATCGPGVGCYIFCVEIGVGGGGGGGGGGGRARSEVRGDEEVRGRFLCGGVEGLQAGMQRYGWGGRFLAWGRVVANGFGFAILKEGWKTSEVECLIVRVWNLALRKGERSREEVEVEE